MNLFEAFGQNSRSISHCGANFLHRAKTLAIFVYEHSPTAYRKSMTDEAVTFLGYEWVLLEDGLITVGINDQGLEEFTEINSISLPSEDEDVHPDEVCGELDTDQGPLNLYSPVAGVVVEVNEAVSENPSLIMEEPYGDGWLFKVEPDNVADFEELSKASTNDDE